jgi:NAD(P)-dependent dehydrogenase (short-subunit alcohol dehydrogenase family)
MNLQLTGQVAVVAGAARGIGRAIADAFADAGAAVALWDREPAVSTTAAEIGKARGVRTAGTAVDCTDYEAVKRAAAAAVAEFGRVDHLAFAVGAGSGKFGFPFWNLEPADWPRVLAINVTAAVNAAHALVPTFTAARRGTMVFLSSVAGQIGSQTDPPYSAAKAALINFAQCAAKDLAPYNVRVNTVCPGMVKTELNRGIWQAWNRNQPPERRLSFDDWAEEKIRKMVPLGRRQEPEDVAAMAVFLASDAGRNVTGQTINVDGGFVMHW